MFKDDKKVLFILVFIVTIVAGLTASPLPSRPPDYKIECIKNPTPTHVEEKITELIIVKKFNYQPEGKRKFYPCDITIDKVGNIYAYDIDIKNIYKFDRNYNFIKAFAGKGDEQGKFKTGSGRNNIFLSKDGFFYASNKAGKKVMKFDLDGNFIKEWKINPEIFPRRSVQFKAIVSPDGYFFAKNLWQCTMDVVNLKDKELKIHYRLLGPEAFTRALFVDFDNDNSFIAYKSLWVQFNFLNSDYNIAAGNRLLIYIGNDSTVYIFNGRKLEKKLRLWPKQALENVKNFYDEMRKTPDYIGPRFWHPFRRIVVDPDNDKTFYMAHIKTLRSPWLLYHFDFDGKLLEVLKAPVYTFDLIAIRNGLFYSTDGRNIYIFKEKKK